MSEKNDILCNEDTVNEATPHTENASSKVVVRRKRFKKSDILVFAICLAISVCIWMYASNLEKTAADNEINKELIEDAVQSGVQSGISKTTESTEDSEESSLDSKEESSESLTEDNSSDESESELASNKGDKELEID